jgi:hypothetical protein
VKEAVGALTPALGRMKQMRLRHPGACRKFHEKGSEVKPRPCEIPQRVQTQQGEKTAPASRKDHAWPNPEDLLQ